MLTDIYAQVAQCDDASVTLGEYDAMLCEWLREVLAENENRSLRSIAKDAGLHAPDISRARSGKRNVSKEMFVGVAAVLGMRLSEAFDKLAKIADRYEHGLLKLKVRAVPADGIITVRAEHAAATQKISTAVSRGRGADNRKSTQSRRELPPAAPASPSHRKS